MKLKVKVNPKSFRYKYQSVFSDVAVKDICGRIGRKRIIDARKKATELAKKAEADIKSKFGAPEPGVWGPRIDNPNTMNVSDAISQEPVILSEEENKVLFKFARPSELTRKTDIGSKLKGIGAWELWEEGKSYWSPQKGKVWVFRRGTKGKYGLGAMILVDKGVADRFLQPIRQFRAPIFKTVKRNLIAQKNLMCKEIKKSLHDRWIKYGQG